MRRCVSLVLAAMLVMLTIYSQGLNAYAATEGDADIPIEVSATMIDIKVEVYTPIAINPSNEDTPIKGGKLDIFNLENSPINVECYFEMGSNNFELVGSDYTTDWDNLPSADVNPIYLKYDATDYWLSTTNNSWNSGDKDTYITGVIDAKGRGRLTMDSAASRCGRTFKSDSSGVLKVKYIVSLQ